MQALARVIIFLQIDGYTRATAGANALRCVPIQTHLTPARQS
jgi:hypothetical protein